MTASITVLSGCAIIPPITSTPTVTNTPQVSNVIGHVTWQGRPAQPNALQQLPITLTLKLGTSETNYQNLSTDTSGYFTASVTGLAFGTYNWRVKSPKYLARTGTVTLDGTPDISLDVGLMAAGDCNNDNIVDVSDFNILKQAFGKAIGDAGYDDRVDFTGDQAVSISDFNLLRQNVGLSGAPPTGSGGPGRK
jgi:hypothetical protein